MQVTITRLRQELFQLVERAREGEPIEFSYKGSRLRITAEGKPSKLARLTPERVLATDTDLAAAGRRLRKDMEAEWESDWSEV
jgi:antitoxin (DNA-binding transcriptional repressor) of toxin-antitoxin stability system